MFIDKVSVTLRAGNGGNGAVSFRHEKYVDRGGPDGGDGGRGGDIEVVATTNVDSLAAFRFKKLIEAPSGKNGSGVRRHGRSAKKLVIALPVGTVVFRPDGTVAADLAEDGQTVVIAKGGRGGFGNAHFVSSVRQAPRVAERGEFGESYEAVFELKLLADVGLVGLPNAGKSTLLSVISNAKPQIANYPFTTLIPNIGVVDIADSSSLLVADIPGLIEGASVGKGLGDEFLRHVERTAVLVHLIDAAQEDIPQAYKTIVDELNAYNATLMQRKQIIVLTKIDLVEASVLKKALAAVKKAAGKDATILSISAQAHTNLEPLKFAMSEAVKQYRDKVSTEEDGETIIGLPVIGMRAKPDSWHIDLAAPHEFVITGHKIEKFAQRTFFDDFHGQQRLRDIMYKMGIMHELARRGVVVGDIICVGNPEIGRFTF